MIALLRHILISGGLLAMVSACSPPPGLEAGNRIASSNQPVILLPLDEILVQAEGGAANDASAAALAARAAQLRARVGAD